MRPKPLLLLSVMSGLAACATGPGAPEVLIGASAPAPTPGRDWFFSAGAEAARLAYGVEASDDLRIGLDCDRGAGRLELSRNATTGSAAEIHLESGGETERYAARSEPSQLDDGVFLTGEAATSDPVFRRFRSVGWLALWRDGEREVYVPHPAARAEVERFFAFCG
jgi:hypothetical protein